MTELQPEQVDGGEAESESTFSNWWYFLFPMPMIAAISWFEFLLNRLLDRPDDNLFLMAAVFLQAVAIGQAQPKTLPHLAILSAATTGIAVFVVLGCVGTVLLSGSTVILVMGAGLSVGTAALFVRPVYRRLGVPLRPIATKSAPSGVAPPGTGANGNGDSPA